MHNDEGEGTQDNTGEDIGGRALQTANWLMTKSAEGFSKFTGAVTLAEQYVNDQSYADNDARVAALIRWEGAKNFSTGMATGIGGLATLPFSIPAGLGAGWILQGRLAMAIAHIYGHDVRDERVRTLVLIAVLGENMLKEPIKAAGVEISKRAAANAIKKLPVQALKEVNKAIGMRLITKAGQSGVINLTKIVPVLGGIVGGTVDAVMCAGVGTVATRLFRPTDTVAA
jgi:uncharacterized protein (DUF697 family)